MPSLLNKLILQETQKLFETFPNVVFVDYTGFTQEDSIEIRTETKKCEGKVIILKNNLTLLALKEKGFEGSEALFTSPVMGLFGEDPVALSKVAIDFVEKSKKGGVNGGIIDGRISDAKEIKGLSKLPSKEVLLAQLLGVMNGPARGLVTVLSGPMRGLATALDAVREQKEQAS